MKPTTSFCLSEQFKHVIHINIAKNIA